MSKDDFVTAANAACSRAKERIAENTERIPEELRSVDPFGPDEVSPEDLRRLAPTTAELGDIYGNLRNDLEQFEPPSADADRIAKILKDLADGAKEFEEAAASFRSGTRPQDKTPIAAIAAPSRELADYGADSCLHSGN